MQEDFLEVMKTYPESFKAMDLVAEHRLRALHRTAAWQAGQQSSSETHLGSIIEQILQVGLAQDSRSVIACFADEQSGLYEPFALSTFCAGLFGEH